MGQALKVGLVLSGGGTKGGAHIGVLKALEEHNIEVSYVVGTSVGAIIGAMYAAGMSPDEIAAAIAAIDWNDVLSDDPPRPTVPVQIKRDDFDYLVKSKLGFTKGKIELPLGIAQGQKVTRLLRQLLHASTTMQDFDNLTIPFRAVATSLETGEAVVLASGDLPLSVRASMSLPGVFAPVEIDGQLLVDGGVAANLPINVARDMGAERIIAVDITSELLPHDQIKSLLTVTQQLIGIMTRRNVDAQVAQSHPQDIIIRPDVSRISTLDFAKTVDAIDPGYSAAYTHTIALQNLAETAYRPGNLARRSNLEAAPVIAFAEVDDNSGLSHQAVLARLNIDVGQAFDRRALDRSISRLYGTGLYQRIDYNLVERNGQTGIVVNAEAKAWGPDYLQFGLQLEEDFSADANFNIGVAFLQTGINPLGGQWRSQLDLGSRQGIHSEWYQPWNDDGRLFSRFRVGYERNNLRVFDPQGTALADLRIQELGTSVSVGHQLGRASELEMSWQRLFGEAEELVGQVALTDNNFDVAELALAFRLDTLNRTARPSSGSLVRATVLSSSRYTDGRDDYEQVHAIASRSMRLGRGQISVVGIAGTTLDSNAPIQSTYMLGGLGRLSGHPVDRFLGQHIALLRGNISRDFRSTVIPLFLGASLEAGNTWDTDFNDGPDNWITAGSIYGGFDTFLGPVYLAAGFAEGGQRSLYLSLGNPFAVKAIRPFD